MKQTDSTEMDRLLRRHFRRDSETPRDGSRENAPGSNSAAHMDADEMNAYAEGTLPEAARSRYFAHLADCDDCRRLVTELTLAYGATTEKKRAAIVEAPPSKSWREWLAALLSPPVLRYGVPALALFAVIIVAIVAMRARRDESYMAQNEKAARNSAIQSQASSNSAATESSTTTTDENHANVNALNSNTASPAVAQQSQATPAATPTPPAKATVEENAPAVSPSVAAKPEVQSGGILDRKQERELGEDAKTDRPVGGATTPARQPAPPAPTDSDDMAKREEQKKTKAVAKEADETVVVTNNAGAATTQTTSAESTRGRRAAARSAQNMAVMRPSAPASEPSGAAGEKDSSSETRTVSGHRFRRQGNIWVDTAYNSSRSTINVARGSEQYRALLADEPVLRAITQQLGGEVIVVWGNKAYRFY